MSNISNMSNVSDMCNMSQALKPMISHLIVPAASPFTSGRSPTPCTTLVFLYISVLINATVLCFIWAVMLSPMFCI